MLSGAKSRKAGNFKEYRQKTGYSEKSIKSHDYHIEKFTGWCNKNKINYKTISFDQLLQYVREEKTRGAKEQSINNRLNAASIYYDWLVTSGETKQNIIRQIRVRNTGKKVFKQLLKPEQLEKLYNNYCNQPGWSFRTTREKKLHQRNQVVLGLMVYQGITTGELAKLETGHVNLKDGKIYIPSTRKSDARTLKLQASQILPLQEYISQIEKGPMFPCRKPTDLVSRVIKQAKHVLPELQSSRQMRQSVIMNWLKECNIRQVQYMAGHKKIRSTEAYKNEDLSDLVAQVEKYYPLR